MESEGNRHGIYPKVLISKGAIFKLKQVMRR